MGFVARSVWLGSLMALAALVATAVKGGLVTEALVNGVLPSFAALAVDPPRTSAAQLAGPARLTESRAAVGSGVCGGFSEDGRYDDVPVTWSFRLCEIAEHAYEVQLRFRNVSARPARSVRFAYRVWLAPPATCEAAESERSPVLEGEKELSPAEVDEWPYAGGVVLRRAYRGEIWSCALLRG